MPSSEALIYMGLQPSKRSMICTSTRCSLAVATNSRIEDMRSPAIVKKITKSRKKRQLAMVVPGSGLQSAEQGLTSSSKQRALSGGSQAAPHVSGDERADRLSLASAALQPTETLKAGKARAAERTWSARPCSCGSRMVSVDVRRFVEQKEHPRKFHLCSSPRAGAYLFFVWLQYDAASARCSSAQVLRLKTQRKKIRPNDAEIHPSPRLSCLMDRRNVDTDAIIQAIPQIDPQTDWHQLV
jgi:hypothetical protein